jgi:hypothetical protein
VLGHLALVEDGADLEADFSFATHRLALAGHRGGDAGEVPSSRRMNLWLHWKRLLQALAGKAGGAAVMTTVDHPLMRGSKPHDR